MNDPSRFEPDGVMSDTVADAWAEVIISIHERLEAEQADAPNSDEAPSPSRPGARVAVGQDVTGDDPTSPIDAFGIGVGAIEAVLERAARAGLVRQELGQGWVPLNM